MKKFWLMFIFVFMFSSNFILAMPVYSRKINYECWNENVLEWVCTTFGILGYIFSGLWVFKAPYTSKAVIIPQLLTLISEYGLLMVFKDFYLPCWSTYVFFVILSFAYDIVRFYFFVFIATYYPIHGFGTGLGIL